MFVTKIPPPRTYKYFHETLLAGPRDGSKDGDHTPTPQWRIVGGKVATIEEIPYQVLYGLYCGGSLIAPEWVITAAHCKDKDNFVYVGSTYRSKSVPYQICAHFFHPLWNKTKLHTHDYDYQLLLLESPVPVTSTTRPIAIGSLDNVKPGDLMSVSGWGHLKYKEGKMQDLLRRVFIPIISDSECRNLAHGKYINITSRMFCAGFLTGSKDSCQGDSGGPAVVAGKLLGLVSFGIGCALPDLPGVYSLIPVVRDWIRTVTALPL
ncbi:trypsin-like [Epargyreus clarus]|uniref:trypsin-like n=1 Tax=Epargyreus clarus TaxID=520877 RepID=UPI003C2ACB3C